MDLSDLWQRVQETFESLEQSQEKRVWSIANKVNPHFILDDLLNPHDHPELLNHPRFNFEDGQLSGLRSARIAINALVKEMIETTLPQPHEFLATHQPHPHPRSRTYRAEPWGWDLREVEIQEVETLILTRFQSHQQPSAVIFDLDGTLFDVGYRTLGILKEWLATPEAKAFDPKIMRHVHSISFNHIGYSLGHAFENAGLDLRNLEVSEILAAAEKTWRKRFFDGKSILEFDSPMPGAAEFVKKIQAQGIKIVYLTGRFRQMMLEGSKEQLKAGGFPVENCEIILKGDPAYEDHTFKAEAFADVASRYNILGNFENEYVNICGMIASQKAEHCTHVIVDTQHSGRPTPPLTTPVLRLSSFQ
jgi:hypothetical protein